MGKKSIRLPPSPIFSPSTTQPGQLETHDDYYYRRKYSEASLEL